MRLVFTIETRKKPKTRLRCLR